MIGVQDGAGLATIANVSVRDGGGNAAIDRISVLTDLGDYVVFEAGGGSLTVLHDPYAVTGSGSSSSGTITVNTSETTVAVDGGTAPFTYAWTKVAGDANWVINSPSSATTRFRHNAVAPNTQQDATFRCTVADARGRTGTTDVEATVYNFGGFA